LKLVSPQAKAKRKGAIYYFELTNYETGKPRESSKHVQIGTHITLQSKKEPFISASP
jgi:hypothetical protein